MGCGTSSNAAAAADDVPSLLSAAADAWLQPLVTPHEYTVLLRPVLATHRVRSVRDLALLVVESGGGRGSVRLPASVVTKLRHLIAQLRQPQLQPGGGAVVVGAAATPQLIGTAGGSLTQIGSITSRDVRVDVHSPAVAAPVGGGGGSAAAGNSVLVTSMTAAVVNMYLGNAMSPILDEKKQPVAPGIAPRSGIPDGSVWMLKSTVWHLMDELQELQYWTKMPDAAVETQWRRLSIARPVPAPADDDEPPLHWHSKYAQLDTANAKLDLESVLERVRKLTPQTDALFSFAAERGGWYLVVRLDKRDTPDTVRELLRRVHRQGVVPNVGVARQSPRGAALPIVLWLTGWDWFDPRYPREPWPERFTAAKRPHR